ncbi:ABC transporter permease subunit [Phormidesmis sp. 146-12]
MPTETSHPSTKRDPVVKSFNSTQGVALRSVTKKYGSFTAIENLNLEVAAGSYCYLVVNSMMRIDRALITAAEDAGASGFQIQKEIILPLVAPGIAIGTIFVVTSVMGEFATVRLMSGGQSSSIGYLIKNQIGSLQYPLAAANAVILLAITLLLVFSILRVVDIRKEL